jgi:hypothetical protein
VLRSDFVAGTAAYRDKKVVGALCVSCAASACVQGVLSRLNNRYAASDDQSREEERLSLPRFRISDCHCIL